MNNSMRCVITLGWIVGCGAAVAGENSPTSTRAARPKVIGALAQVDADTARNVETKTKPPIKDVECEGEYRHHLQGICTNDTDAIYWSFTTTLVKTNMDGKVVEQTEVANHHGDLCHHEGKVYVAVNLGRFNDPDGNADSWIYVYNADDLSVVSKHETQEVFHGAGGIGFLNDHFFVVGGLPDGIEQNYVYEYDGDFKFVKKHIIKSGHTHLGIQTAAYAGGKWFFGCYGDPQILLVTDTDFNLLGRHEFDCSLGIVGLPTGRLLSASGRCEQGKGCTGMAEVAYHNKGEPLRFFHRPMLIESVQLLEKLDSQRVRIVDVRPAAEYAEGHVPGAVHVEVDDWKSLAVSDRGLHDTEAWGKRLGALGIDSGTHVVVYGSRVSNSARIWWLLKYVGLTDVSLVNGGWNTWVQEDHPIETSVPKVTPKKFLPNFQTDRLAEIDSVKESLSSKTVKIVDTRSDDEFASGHVPSSVHLEWKHLLSDDGRFKTPRQLKTLFHEQGILAAETAVCY